MQRPIWLIGMMGSGKSTVAPLVAAALGRQWVDADTLIEERTGCSIADLIGESEMLFREAEVAAMRALAAGQAVVATGGGAVMTEAAEIMRHNGVVVWLRCRVETLADRVGNGFARPLLTEGSAALEGIDSERRDRYLALADVVIDTDDLNPEAVANVVVKAWESASSVV